jgi:LCP family protein required for cell wall assembly
MNPRKPFRRRAAPPAAAIAPAIYPPGALVPAPNVHYGLARRAPSRAKSLVFGYLLGLVGGSLCLVATLLAVVFVLPPPRTNILLLGLDRRPQETHYVVRTDTMILTTLNPDGAYVGMLSIPRDLYIMLPWGYRGRINTAHVFAENDAPGTGPAAAMETVRQNFGVEVHHYVRVDLIGFVRIVDAMGGVELDVPRPLIDYQYPTYDYGTRVVEFQAGPQHLDGEAALAYARIRHGSSDFQRAERQQLVLRALFAQLLKPATWPRLPAVLDAVNEAIDTDVSPLLALRLAPTLLRAGPDGLDSRVIQGDMVQPYTTEGGGAVQLPVWERINPVLLEMFGQ